MESITIILDGAEVSGHSEMSILELATEVGIKIPTLCYDSHLSPLGACRVCLVEDEVSGRLLASCVTPIASGMVINTQSKRVLENRRVVVELMLASHPDSCIVCDKGNRCKLRQIATDLGIGLSSLEKIPTYQPVVDLNPFIQRDLSKCIRCGRCIRADQEIAVIGAIDYTDRGFEARPATFLDAPLEQTECNFCGICVTVCPTGALSERTRPSTLTATEVTQTACTLCGMGCAVLLEHRDGQVLGVSPAEDEHSVNHVSLCVKGHYGMDFINSRERLTTPLIRQAGQLLPRSWPEALDLVAGQFMELKRIHGPLALGALGSSAGTNEENYLLQKFVRVAFGCNNIDSGARLRISSLMAGIERVLGLSAMTNPIAHIREAAEIFIIGADPLVAGPIAGQMIKQAVKFKGAHLTLVDPMPQGLTSFSDVWIRPRPGTYSLFLAGLLREVISLGCPKSDLNAHKSEWVSRLKPQLESFRPEKVQDEAGVPAPLLVNTAKRLAASRKMAIIAGSSIAGEEDAYYSGVLLAALALLTGNTWKSGCGLFPLAASLNDQGAMDMGAWPEKLPGHQYQSDSEAIMKLEQVWGVTLPTEKGLDYLSMIDAAEQGQLAGLYIIGENPVLDCPDGTKVKGILSSLPFLVVQDRFLTETAKLAQVVLPSASFAEKDGTWTSVERRVQRLRQAVAPVGGARPDWEVFRDLFQRMGSRAPYKTSSDILREINETVPIYSGITNDHLEQEDVFWPCYDSENPGTEILYAHSSQNGHIDNTLEMSDFTAPKGQEAYPFSLVVREGLFCSRDRAASANTKAIQAAGGPDRVRMNPLDAEAGRFTDGDMVRIHSAIGSTTGQVFLDREIPRGILLAVNSPSFGLNRLFSMTYRDPFSGTPKLNRTAVQVEVANEYE